MDVGFSSHMVAETQVRRKLRPFVEGASLLFVDTDEQPVVEWF